MTKDKILKRAKINGSDGWLSSYLKVPTPVVNVIKVPTAVTSVLDVIKHFYGRILRQQSHLAA